MNGAGADYSTWDPQGKPVCGSRDSVPAQSEIQQFFAFVKRIKAEVVWVFHWPGSIRQPRPVRRVRGRSGRKVPNRMDPRQRTGAVHQGGIAAVDLDLRPVLRAVVVTRKAVVAAVPHIGFVGPESVAQATSSPGSLMPLAAGFRRSAITFMRAPKPTKPLPPLGHGGQKKGETADDHLWNDDMKGAHVPLWELRQVPSPTAACPVFGHLCGRSLVGGPPFDVATLRSARSTCRKHSAAPPTTLFLRLRRSRLFTTGCSFTMMPCRPRQIALPRMSRCRPPRT